jgi:serine/threonine-protein kinase HipA
MSYHSVKAVEVKLWGQSVGALAQDPSTGFFAFEYDPHWLSTGLEISPLHLPARPGVFVFPTLSVDTYQRLPAAIADALPDEFGNQIVNAWMASKGVAADQITPLDRLAYVGTRAMGAMEFHPHRASPKPPSIIEVSDLVMSARALMEGSFADDRESATALRQLLHVGTSAGGQRAKAIIAFNPATRQMHASSVLLKPGFAHWLLKLDGVSAASKNSHAEPGKTAGFGRVEYAYHLMSIAAGIQMTVCTLLEENGRAHFLTKRFDRQGEDKVHTQTLCAMAHLDYKQLATHDYAQLFQVIDSLKLGSAARQEAFRRMAFNVLAMNCDDHTKNFAFLMDREGKWTLSPAYDVTFAYSPTSYWVSQHLMGVNGKFKDITSADLLSFASSLKVANASAIIAKVEQAIALWPEFANQANVPPSLVAHIQQFIEQPLLSAATPRSSRP